MPEFNILLLISGSVMYHNSTTTRTSQMISLDSIFSLLRFSLVCCQINIIQKHNGHCLIHRINFLGLYCHLSFSSLPSYAVMLFCSSPSAYQPNPSICNPRNGPFVSAFFRFFLSSHHSKLPCSFC